MNVRHAAAAAFAASLLALPAHADEGIDRASEASEELERAGRPKADQARIVPVLGETRVTRERASLMIRNGGEVPFVVDARLEFTDLLSGEVMTTVIFSRATVGAGKDSSVRLAASIPGDALPRSAYLVRVVAEASAPEDAALIATTRPHEE